MLFYLPFFCLFPLSCMAYVSSSVTVVRCLPEVHISITDDLFILCTDILSALDKIAI